MLLCYFALTYCTARAGCSQKNWGNKKSFHEMKGDVGMAVRKNDSNKALSLLIVNDHMQPLPTSFFVPVEDLKTEKRM
jgi:hypothetical protein